MIKNRISLLILAFCACFSSVTFSQTNKPAEKIHWYTMDEAMKLNAEKPKKVFMDIYTDWCGWCKVLDKSTFPNPVIVEKMNKYFYAVKFNAERTDTIRFHGTAFINPNPGVGRSPHQFAAALLKGRMSYPSMVYFNTLLKDSLSMITLVQSYMKPSQLEPVLEYIGGDYFKTMTYDTFMLKYKVLANDDWAPPVKPAVMNTVKFDDGKNILKEATNAQLDSVANILLNNPAMKIEIDGYTDNTGNAATNETLSLNRAIAVYNYFVGKGIDTARLSYAGFGSSNPIADNSTAEGKKENNRIEIKVK